ncbi:MAG: glycosyl transferase, group 1 [Marmoricola sp.]|nr:glycosyl transferase, group 1 [Marmoricola sp.]
MSRKIVISINTAWNIYNFRRGLVSALFQRGYEVVAVAPEDEYVHRLQGLGCRFVPLLMDNNGTHPGRDLLLLARYARILRSEKPVAYLGYTVKPNIYGSIAAHMLGVPVINNIAGLGTAFIRQGLLTDIVRQLYRHALRRSHTVFFQNEDDRQLFVSTGLVDERRTGKLPGSGLNLAHYHPLQAVENSDRQSGNDPQEGRFSFLLVARMLRDKGVEEFVQAARLVRQSAPQAQFRLLGKIDAANPNSIPASCIRAWEEEGLLSYLGNCDDVRPHLQEAGCVVLPSYREGVPRCLLEAAAMERPIIATDTVGCKDVVEHGVNGFLCRLKNSADLADRMMDMLNLQPRRRIEMGQAGRRKIAAEFDERFVIQKYLNAIDHIEAGTWTNAAHAQEMDNT